MILDTNLKHTKLWQCTTNSSISVTSTVSVRSCVLLVTGRRNPVGEATHWWCGQWTNARVCCNQRRSHAGAPRLKWVVAAIHGLLKSIPNSVSEWFYVRTIRGHMFEGSINVMYSRHCQGVIGSVWRCSVLLHGQRVALTFCTNFGLQIISEHVQQCGNCRREVGRGVRPSQFMSSTPLVWFIRLSWGSENNPLPRSH